MRSLRRKLLQQIFSVSRKLWSIFQEQVGEFITLTSAPVEKRPSEAGPKRLEQPLTSDFFRREVDVGALPEFRASSKEPLRLWVLPRNTTSLVVTWTTEPISAGEVRRSNAVLWVFEEQNPVRGVVVDAAQGAVHFDALPKGQAFRAELWSKSGHRLLGVSQGTVALSGGPSEVMRQDTQGETMSSASPVGPFSS